MTHEAAKNAAFFVSPLLHKNLSTNRIVVDNFRISAAINRAKNRNFVAKNF